MSIKIGQVEIYGSELVPEEFRRIDYIFKTWIDDNPMRGYFYRTIRTLGCAFWQTKYEKFKKNDIDKIPFEKTIRDLYPHNKTLNLE